jgi:hypothetical protein
MTNENDDWEIAVDTGEFDKRLEQQEKDRTTIQESRSDIVNDDENQNLMKLNKPIRILKRPTSQSQLPVSNDRNNSLQISTNNTNSPFSNEISSSITVPSISIIPRNQNKDSINSSQISLQSTKPTIKTYEQRELEYRLARLRIMGEEESSAKDDDDDENPPTVEMTSITSDEPSQITFPSQSSLQSHSTPGSYASNLYALNNTSPNIAAIHFTPNTNTTGPFSQQQYRPVYSSPYPLMPLPPTHYPTATVYLSSPSNYPIQPSVNPWYQYQQQQTPYGTQQYDHPQ